MATRSTITIKGDRLAIHLYRHWDGYPEATGRHLARVLRSIKPINFDQLVVALLTAKESEPFASGNYELTGDAQAHWDREWHYEITLERHQEPRVRVFHKPIGESIRLEWEGPLSRYRIWTMSRLRQFFARIKRMKKERAA